MNKQLLTFFLAIMLTVMSVLTVAQRAESYLLTVDPGAAGTSYFSNDFLFVGALNGTALNGQTQSVDIIFKNNKLAVAGKFGIDLWINQSDPMGTSPKYFSSVTGYLLDSSGNPLSVSSNFSNMGNMPTQVWPGWGYYLPDGKEYLPAATGYSKYLTGASTNFQPNGDYYFDPFIFSGIHFDITFPVDPSITVMGLRAAIYNYSDYSEGTYLYPIYISPDPIPEFLHHIPEPATILLLGCGLIGLGAFRRRKKQ